jgi:hypothetical protein
MEWNGSNHMNCLTSILHPSSASDTASRAMHACKIRLVVIELVGRPIATSIHKYPCWINSRMKESMNQSLGVRDTTLCRAGWATDCMGFYTMMPAGQPVEQYGCIVYK